MAESAAAAVDAAPAVNNAAADVTPQLDIYAMGVTAELLIHEWVLRINRLEVRCEILVAMCHDRGAVIPNHLHSFAERCAH